MSKLYVLGGRQRKVGLKAPTFRDEWYLYEAALILEVDTEAGTARTCVEHETPREKRAGDQRAGNFHSGALIGDRLYTCTMTEILIYRVPQFEQVGYISLPCFNDLHHVTPARDGDLLVVSTGLDMVFKVKLSGDVVKEWCVIDEVPWSRFSRAVDYRTVITTRPHQSHPNFTFELEGETWVTRFEQGDAISLNGSGKRIATGVYRPHDGLVCGDRVLFTGVEGKIVIANRRTLAIEETIDLRKIQDRDKGILPAWCRGLLPIDEKTIWVGFTRIRQTLLRENVRWVKTVLQEGTVAKPTQIALFDIVERRCLQAIDLEPHGMHTVFGIFPALC
ncbi:MAG TPA: hypothetical protein VMG31_01730 [Verrucomicrobiae bacterium]|nr:hypothetical protein [Verrucomicrobiae bacterium]